MYLQSNVYDTACCSPKLLDTCLFPAGRFVRVQWPVTTHGSARIVYSKVLCQGPYSKACKPSRPEPWTSPATPTLNPVLNKVALLLHDADRDSFTFAELHLLSKLYSHEVQ